MEIKDLQANQGKVDLVVEVVELKEARTFEKFGKSGTVCNAKGKDDSGEITLTLWNEQVGNVSIGDKVHIENGWCSEYRDERQLSTGKFGKLEVVEKAPVDTVVTNDPSILAGAASEMSDDEPQQINEEELIE